MGTGAEARVIGIRELVYLKDNPGLVVDSSIPYGPYDPSVLQLDFYGREVKESWTPNPQYRDMSAEADEVVKLVADVALKAWRVLGCRDGGRIDVRHGPKRHP